MAYRPLACSRKVLKAPRGDRFRMHRKLEFVDTFTSPDLDPYVLADGIFCAALEGVAWRQQWTLSRGWILEPFARCFYVRMSWGRLSWGAWAAGASFAPALSQLLSPSSFPFLPSWLAMRTPRPHFPQTPAPDAVRSPRNRPLTIDRNLSRFSRHASTSIPKCSWPRASSQGSARPSGARYFDW